MPRKKQAALFSATMPPMIKDLAAKFMYRPQEVSVAPANKPIESIEQRVYGVAQSRKQSALIEQLSQPEVELALVFVGQNGAQIGFSVYLIKRELPARPFMGIVARTA